MHHLLICGFHNILNNIHNIDYTSWFLSTLEGETIETKCTLKQQKCANLWVCACNSISTAQFAADLFECLSE